MMNILIPTQPNDIHAMFVQAALKKKGHQAMLWHTGDFPTQQFHSFELFDKKSSWHAYGINFEIKNPEFDVVWYRRPHRPILINTVHPNDLENAKKECSMFYQTFWEIIAPNATWVNPPTKAKTANSKFLQLQIANEVELKIPNTLISNDPKKIKAFIEKHKEEGTIYKALTPVAWVTDNELRLTYTKQISLKELPSENVLKMTPGIFQQKISKAYELRITYFGEYPVAAKLKSQEHPKGLTDWRYVPTHELNVEKYDLPEMLNIKCKAFMKKLGLLFGCFDFIVTPQGEYYFLEINEGGQFLWIEFVNPKIKMLDIFSEFLINQHSAFQWKENSDTLSLNDFEQQTEILFREIEKLHVSKNFL